MGASGWSELAEEGEKGLGFGEFCGNGKGVSLRGFWDFRRGEIALITGCRDIVGARVMEPGGGKNNLRIRGI